jgi:hypothetical protein
MSTGHEFKVPMDAEGARRTLEAVAPWHRTYFVRLQTDNAGSVLVNPAQVAFITDDEVPQ